MILKFVDHLDQTVLAVFTKLVAYIDTLYERMNYQRRELDNYIITKLYLAGTQALLLYT